MRWLVFGIIALCALQAVMAAPAGAQISGTSTERTLEGTSGTVTTEGGNLTQVNVSGTPITTRWGSFWGEISGGILLGDSSNNVFFEWAVTDPSGGVVYATNGTVGDWSPANIEPASVSEMPSYLQERASDNFSNTFNQTGDFNSTSFNIANVPFTTSWQNGSQEANFSTYALKTSDNSTLIWAANVVADLISFKGAGNTTDYQLLVPANSVGVTYNFYLEFR